MVSYHFWGVTIYQNEGHEGNIKIISCTFCVYPIPIQYTQYTGQHNNNHKYIRIWQLNSKLSPDHHVGNLDNRVFIRLREDTLTSGTFNIKWEDSQRGDILPITLRGMWYNFLPWDVQLQLTTSSNSILTF